MSTPDSLKCAHCTGFGTLIQEIKGGAQSWWRRWNIGCMICQRTGLKAIPESEVIKEAR